MYVYLCLPLCLYCLLYLCLKINYETKNKQTSILTVSYSLFLSFKSWHFFGPLVHSIITESHQLAIMDIVNLVSFMFSVSFFLVSTNMLGSLCYKYIIMLISQGVIKNKLNNSYKFLTWHRVDIQHMVILFFFPL